ncbi:MAG: hypothetical protein KAV82_01970 [Phycisphaerae bacterium]|nr:hypothetical protein [Phycisphaerae bacterium]
MKSTLMCFCMVASAIPVFPAFAASPTTQPGGHGIHPPLPRQQYFVQCRITIQDKPTVFETPVALSSPVVAAELKQLVELPAPVHPVHLTRYLPRARREQSVHEVKGEGGKPAVELSIVGPTQSFQRWLMAGDAERNRLSSFIGVWRYMAVEGKSQRDELFEQFKNEFSGEPNLVISRVDGESTHELEALPGKVRRLDDLGCTVRVLTFHPHFAMSKSTNKPVNVSGKRLNPAVQVELEANGKKEVRWVFAKFPDFKMHEGQALPYKIVLDCPVEAKSNVPDFVLMTINRGVHEVWARHEGKAKSKPLSLNQKIKIGASQYTFHLARFVASGRLVEKYAPTEARGGSPALRLGSADATGRNITFWLGLNEQRVITTPVGPMTVIFTSRQANSKGVHP